MTSLRKRLGIGLLLDALRGRFRRSRPAQPRPEHAEPSPAQANPMALKRAARLTAQKTQPAPVVDKGDALMPEQARTGG